MPHPPFKQPGRDFVAKAVTFALMSRISTLEALLDERPDDPFVIYALATEYQQAGQTMQALLMYEHLIQNHPDYIATYYHYAKTLYEGGNRTEAIKLLEKGIERGLAVKDMHAVGEMRGMLEVMIGD